MTPKQKARALVVFKKHRNSIGDTGEGLMKQFWDRDDFMVGYAAACADADKILIKEIKDHIQAIYDTEYGPRIASAVKRWQDVIDEWREGTKGGS